MHSSWVCCHSTHHHVELFVVTFQSRKAVRAIWIHHMCFSLAALLLQVQTIWVYSMLLHCCFVFTLFEFTAYNVVPAGSGQVGTEHVA